MESASSPCSIEAAITWLRKAFRPDASAGLCIVYQLRLSGERGGLLWIRVDDGRVELSAGTTVAPDVTLRMSAEDFYGMLAGRENADLLFMADRLIVDGDLSLALALRKLFQARV